MANVSVIVTPKFSRHCDRRLYANIMNGILNANCVNSLILKYSKQFTSSTHFATSKTRKLKIWMAFRAIVWDKETDITAIKMEFMCNISLCTCVCVCLCEFFYFSLEITFFLFSEVRLFFTSIPWLACTVSIHCHNGYSLGEFPIYRPRVRVKRK